MALSPADSAAASFSFGWDKANHLVAFCAATWIGFRAFPRAGVALLMGMLLLGISIEGLQALFADGRAYELSDIIADTMGIAVAYLTCKLKNNILSRL